MVTKIARAANMFLYSHYTDLSNCLGPRLIQMETHRTRGRLGLNWSGGGRRDGGGSREGNAGGSGSRKVGDYEMGVEAEKAGV